MKIFRRLIFLVFLLTACSPSVGIKFMEPPPVNIGLEKTIGLYQVNDPYGVKNAIIQAVMSRGASQSFYKIEDLSQKNIGLMYLGGRPSFQEPFGVERSVLQEPGMDIYFRIEVKNAFWEERTRTSTKNVKQGDTTVKQQVVEKFIYSSLSLSVDMVEAGGQKIYLRGQVYTEDQQTRATGAVIDSTRLYISLVPRVLNKVFLDFTPRYVTDHIRLDDSDKKMKDILLLIRNGEYKLAGGQLEEYLKVNRDSAPGFYNLAVTLDAQGEFEKALEYYDKAIILDSKKKYYRSSRQKSVVRRNKAAQFSQKL